MRTETRRVAMLVACAFIFPRGGAQGEMVRHPTPEQTRQCRLEIEAVRNGCDDCGCKVACGCTRDDTRIIERCSGVKDPCKPCETCQPCGACAPCEALLQCLESVSDAPDPRVYGAWEQVIPDGSGSAIDGSLGMPTIHAVLLPSGKVLLASGSGWRNRKGSETYPHPDQHDPDRVFPATGVGLFTRPTQADDDPEDPFMDGNRDMYYRLVNHVAVYDPAQNTFFRVPPPPLVDNQNGGFYPNDLFCSGHLHLPDGNPLFMGGTQYYEPITGVRTSYIFDWKKELLNDWVAFDWRRLHANHPRTTPWTFSGLMERGRWYPTPVPLQDGRLVILSGLFGFDEVPCAEKPCDVEKPYLFEVNHLVELFDPTAFDPDNPGRAWRSIDVKKLSGSPFRQKLDKPAGPSICLDADSLEKQAFEYLPCHLEGANEDRAAHDFEHDAFKLYPHVYNLGRAKGDGSLRDDGAERLFFTREGDFISMRSPDMATMRNVKRTYWMNVGGSRDSPSITFEPGAPRTDDVPSFGTSFIDPNNGAIRLLGGGKNSPGTIFPLSADWRKRTRFVGARGSRDMETFAWPRDEVDEGGWSRADDFLGPYPQDDRILSSAILLPTKEVLVINGGNYQLQKPITHPLLLTPRLGNGTFDGYDVRRMNEATQPRQYHAVALLLPDGRVWTSGGNTAPAMVNTEEADWVQWEQGEKPGVGQPKHNPDFVDLDVYFFREGRYARGAKGSLVLPTENWTAEIFSPPYLFIDGDRRAEIVAIRGAHEVEHTIPGVHGDTTIYLLKSDGEYFTTIEGAPAVESGDGAGHYRLIKLPSVTHAADFGQRLYELPRLDGGKGFRTPNAREANIPRGYYMLFYVDAHGKPAPAKMVLFDDHVDTP